MPSYQQRVAWVTTDEEYHALRPQLDDDEAAWKVVWDLYLEFHPDPDTRQSVADVRIYLALCGDAIGHTCPPGEWGECDQCNEARYEERLRALEPGLETT